MLLIVNLNFFSIIFLGVEVLKVLIFKVVFLLVI